MSLEGDFDPVADFEWAWLTYGAHARKRARGAISQYGWLPRAEGESRELLARTAAMAGVFEAVRTFDPEKGPLSAWINLKISNWVREQTKPPRRRRRREEELDDDHDRPDNQGRTVEEEAEVRAAQRAVRDVLRALDPLEGEILRIAMQLDQCAGFLIEAARRLGISREAAGRAWDRGQRHFTAEWRRRGFTH